MSIDTQEDWWDLLDQAWDGILITTQRLGFDLSQPATANLRRDGLRLMNGVSYFEDLIMARKSRDWERVYHYLEAFWVAAPDRPFIHSLPNWGDLCDLCSEIWVFEKQEN